ncbi:hypothetical protein ACPV5W_18165 [Vibrio astriarenae]
MNPYFKLSLGEGDKLVVVFSSINIPKGKFSASRALESSPSSVLYVNCPSNSWYISPLDKSVSDWKGNAKYLKDFIVSNGFSLDNTIFYGGSMGGYGALLFGTYLQVARVIATGVEAICDIKGGNTSKYLRNDIKVNFPDVREFVNKFNGSLTLIAGEDYIPDVITLKTLELSGANIVTLKGLYHSIPPFLDEKFGLCKIFTDELKGTRLDIPEEYVGDICKESLETLYVFLDVFEQNRKRSYTADVQFSLCNTKPVSASGVNFKRLFLSIYDFNLCGQSQSIKCLPESEVHHDYFFNMALVAMRENNELLALKYCKLSFLNSPYYRKGLIVLYSKLLYKNELYDDALRIISSIDSDALELQWLLASVHLKLGNVNAAKKFLEHRFDESALNGKYLKLIRILHSV